MQCPNDKTVLLITERQGIEIDYCPSCRGVWLDKGELDKLISSQEKIEVQRRSVDFRPNYDEPHHHQDKRHSYSKNDDYSHKKRRKESFLGEIFDF